MKAGQKIQAGDRHRISLGALGVLLCFSLFCSVANLSAGWDVVVEAGIPSLPGKVKPGEPSAAEKSGNTHFSAVEDTANSLDLFVEGNQVLKKNKKECPKKYPAYEQNSGPGFFLEVSFAVSPAFRFPVVTGCRVPLYILHHSLKVPHFIA